MKSNIIIIGAGAAGLMAGIGAAKSAIKQNKAITITILEKMSRPGRKIMITGKGRCNFTNVKDWNDFSRHIRSNPNFIKPAFFNLNPEKLIEFFNENGMECVVERGDRAFPASHRAGEVVDTLIRVAQSLGINIKTGINIESIEKTDEGFNVFCENEEKYLCNKLIIATGGKSYPTTGSTGDGYVWAENLGHKINPLFPSLTAMVPRDYKDLYTEEDSSYMDENIIESKEANKEQLKGHIDRREPLSEIGKKLCGITLTNVNATLFINENEKDSEFGDIAFTDGGIEGPIGFKLSRDCVKSIINSNEVTLILDLKPAVKKNDLEKRVNSLWKEILDDARSENNSYKQSLKILLGKLMPFDLIAGFLEYHPHLLYDSLGRKRRNNEFQAKDVAKALKRWQFDIIGYVGYERSVVTAGGVASNEIVAKTMESKIAKGLYFCGEVTDTDCDTGGYNLHAAFATGYLAGINAVKSL